MRLLFRGNLVEFGSFFNASGAMGFFGDDHWQHPDGNPNKGYPYWYHPWYSAFRLWDDAPRDYTFKAKTMTMRSRLDPAQKRGNLPLQKDGIRLRDRFPECIRLYWLEAAGLNAVGLSNPGMPAAFRSGRWQKRTDAFVISFMPEGATPQERMNDVQALGGLLHNHISEFQAPFAIEFNPNCPNAAQEKMDTLHEVLTWAQLVHAFGIPVLVKLNVRYRVAQLEPIARSPHIAAVVMGNAIPFNDGMHVGIDREKIFGPGRSPLAKFGGGAISGRPLFEHTLVWIEEAKRDRFPKPVIAGGGITSTHDASEILMTGYPVVQGLEAATMFMVRPWNVQQTIDDVNRFFVEQFEANAAANAGRV